MALVFDGRGASWRGTDARGRRTALRHRAAALVACQLVVELAELISVQVISVLGRVLHERKEGREAEAFREIAIKGAAKEGVPLHPHGPRGLGPAEVGEVECFRGVGSPIAILV
eukprot:6663032-Alexandrium_andersonii.AAC.1